MYRRYNCSEPVTKGIVNLIHYCAIRTMIFIYFPKAMLADLPLQYPSLAYLGKR